MKKIFVSIATALLLLTFVPVQSKTDVDPTPTAISSEKTDESAQAQVLINRLDEINAMDKSEMSFSEKKELRKEVRVINSDLKELGGGVYISVGAVILILILLIILL